MKKGIRLFLLPIIFSLILAIFFYSPYFLKHLIPSPLDIIPGMYLPWLDQHRSIFPNGGPVKNPLPSDVVSLTLPLRSYAMEIIKNREWPLWNPRILLGAPLLANFQSAVLNPLNLLYLLKTNFIDIWSIQIILQPVLAFIFFYLFISQYQKDISSNILGSFIWAFNGFFIIWFQYNTVVYAALYLPLALFAISKLSKNYLWGFLLSISLALSVLSGNPPVTLIVFGATSLYTFLIYFKKPKIIILSFVFILLSIIYSAPQLLPGLSSSKNSIRDTDTVAQTANIKYLEPIKLLTIFIPDYFGNPSTRNTWKNSPLYDNSTIYNGILPVILFILSFSLTFKKKHRLLITYSYLIAAISFIFMIPSPISTFIGNLNILGLSSMVFTRFSFLFSFSLAVISSLSVNLIKKNNLDVKKIIFPLSTVFVFIFIPFSISFFLNRYFSKIPTIDYDWITQTKTAFRNCFYPLLFLIINAILLLSLFIFKSPKIKKIFIITIYLLAIVDLNRFFKKYNSFSPIDNFYPKSELTDYLEANSFRFARESSEIIPSNMWLMYPTLQTPSGYDTTYSKDYGQIISLINGGSLNNSSNRYLEIDKFDSPLLDLLSIDHVVATKKDRNGLSIGGSLPITLINKKFEILNDFGRYVVLKNLSNLPFVRPIKQIYYSDNIDQTEKLLNNSNISEIGILYTKLNDIEKLDDQIKISNLEVKSQRISFITSDNNIDLPSFLIISQNFENGWKLKIDNNFSEVYNTNHTFIGLLLPPGNHKIVLEYKPDIFFNSLKLSIIGVSLSLLYLLINLLWKKKQL
ncbi:MAG: YfhO family protein [Candidatus Shapirobacteria bacterium]|nr:YfhO family protein [Candidatus Shapirobacteria bacterium]